MKAEGTDLSSSPLKVLSLFRIKDISLSASSGISQSRTQRHATCQSRTQRQLAKGNSLVRYCLMLSNFSCGIYKGCF